MEPIGKTLKRVINDPGFSSRYEETRNEVLRHAGVQAFLETHADQVDKQTVDRGLSKLLEYVEQSHGCDKCKDLGHCINVLKGHEPNLTLVNGNISLTYTKCRRKTAADHKRKAENMIHSMHMPKEVAGASLIGFEPDAERMEAFRAANRFLAGVQGPHDLPAKGLYFHGKFGVGKSYLLSAIANELAEVNVRTVLVYVPEFLREMKQAIGDQTLQEKIDYVKKAPVLMLDDIGAESMSSWARDEVFGTILNYRMAEKLPTFMTSNFNFTELQHHLTYSQRGEKEEVKAARVMERVHALTIPIAMDGTNRRHQ
ncbi:primosomal protein DnaI [Planococcus lenghuensis]|uniref:Primosomal protein DnaI n=1 Tax=Planococcus lenghuensis TaxID=2213202 RepID=A0A1Q2KXB1_9BACL|nr:primosomal protein DnaI [Planococcus lenghuensis]AQQ52830.1 primosomal protein DnaI [Planococcus lenghuensis]